MKTNTAKIQTRTQNSHAASRYGVGEAEPSFEDRNLRIQNLLGRAHKGDKAAVTILEVIFALA